MRDGEIFLPIRYVGAVLRQPVWRDMHWDVFYIGDRSFRVGVPEKHFPFPSIGGVDGLGIEPDKVAPFLENGRIYVPLKMLPGFDQVAKRSADGTVKLVPPADLRCKN